MNEPSLCRLPNGSSDDDYLCQNRVSPSPLIDRGRLAVHAISLCLLGPLMIGLLHGHGPYAEKKVNTQNREDIILNNTSLDDDDDKR